MAVRRGAGRAWLTLIDALTLAGVATLVLLVALPRTHVRGLLRNEDEIIRDLADLERRQDARRASGATDRDHDGVGEYAPLGDVLEERRGEFERIEGADVWRRGGYYFTVLLPDREAKPVPATSASVHPDYAEVADLLVAWPASPGRTGMRAYCRWPGGVLLQHVIDGYPYGRDPPSPGAPLVRRDAAGAHPADRYDGKDWVPPVFGGAKPAK
jgi:hypothetical protein